MGGWVKNPAVVPGGREAVGPESRNIEIPVLLDSGLTR